VQQHLTWQLEVVAGELLRRLLQPPTGYALHLLNQQQQGPLQQLEPGPCQGEVQPQAAVMEAQHLYSSSRGLGHRPQAGSLLQE
jgi:hypothetical protein